MHDLAPSCGPTLGGTILHLTGGPVRRRASTLDMLACRIGHVMTQASRVDWNVLACVSPPITHPLGPGFYGVEVTGTKAESMAVGTFRYINPVATLAVPPTGPLAGGTRLSIYVNIVCELGLQCIFGGKAPVAASRDSVNRITCTSPPADSLRGGHVALRLNAGGTVMATAVSYRYMPAAEVLSARPASVSELGGTR